MPPDLALRLLPDVAEVPRLLDALDAYAEAQALPPRAAHRLALVCEELAANVAMHGAAGEGAASFVAVSVAREGDVLRLSVEDDGRPFDPLALPEVDLEAPLEEREAGGLGVHVVKRMARSLSYVRQDGRNRLDAVLDAAG